MPLPASALREGGAIKGESVNIGRVSECQGEPVNIRRVSECQDEPVNIRASQCG